MQDGERNRLVAGAGEREGGLASGWLFKRLSQWFRCENTFIWEVSIGHVQYSIGHVHKYEVFVRHTHEDAKCLNLRREIRTEVCPLS